MLCRLFLFLFLFLEKKPNCFLFQVEELEIGSRLPVARFTPIQTSVPSSPPQQSEDLVPEINLDILGGQPVYQGEVEEEEEEEEI